MILVVSFWIKFICRLQETFEIAFGCFFLSLCTYLPLYNVLCPAISCSCISVCVRVRVHVRVCIEQFLILATKLCPIWFNGRYTI
jgi:hypothetical protein